jgi:hypothetical protein
VILAAVAACDPLAGVYVRQSLSPAPAPGCVRATLAASALVASVDAPDVGPDSSSVAYVLRVRDSTAIDGVRDAHLTMERGSTGFALLSVDFVQRGQMTFTFGGARARHLATLGSRLARAVRAACAPQSPNDESCRIEGFGPTRRCHAGT